MNVLVAEKVVLRDSVGSNVGDRVDVVVLSGVNELVLENDMLSVSVIEEDGVKVIVSS